MAHNHNFWIRSFGRDFIPSLNAIVATLEKRLLPAFDDIDVEAKAVGESFWEAAQRTYGHEDADLSELADAAHDAASDHYLLLDGIKQGVVNLFAAALYHAFEQQLIFFLRKEMVDWREENEEKMFSVLELKKRLLEIGINITVFPCWVLIEELKLVANTVKHASGDASKKLHSVRPDLFSPPNTDASYISEMDFSKRVFLPLLGDDLYVTMIDIQKYQKALVAFWEELGVAMQGAG